MAIDLKYVREVSSVRYMLNTSDMTTLIDKEKAQTKG